MVKNGIDRILSYSHLFQGKRIGLITTPTGITSEFVSTIQILHDNFNLTALFSPEHGVRGDQAAGEDVHCPDPAPTPGAVSVSVSKMERGCYYGWIGLLRRDKRIDS